MAEREALRGGWALDELPAVSEPRDGLDSQHEPVTEPIPLVGAEPAGYREDFTYAGPFIDRRPGSLVASLTFKTVRPPWYRARPAVMTICAVAVVGALVALVLVMPRSPGAEDSPGVAPTTAPPTPGSVSPSPASPPTVQPTLTSAPAPPPPPPPPPAEDSAPTITRQYPAPRPVAPSEHKKPELGVTRAPISVTPEPRTPPTSASVGDGGRRGFF